MYCQKLRYLHLIAIGTVTINTKEKYFISVRPTGIVYFYLDTYNNYQQTGEI